MTISMSVDCFLTLMPCRVTSSGEYGFDLADEVLHVDLCLVRVDTEFET